MSRPEWDDPPDPRIIPPGYRMLASGDPAPVFGRSDRGILLEFGKDGIVRWYEALPLDPEREVQP